MKKIEFLIEKRKMCEASIEYCKGKIKLMEDELSVINEMLDEIERRQDNADTAL